MEAHGFFINIRNELGLDNTIGCQETLFSDGSTMLMEMSAPSALDDYVGMCHEMVFISPTLALITTSSGPAPWTKAMKKTVSKTTGDSGTIHPHPPCPGEQTVCKRTGAQKLQRSIG